MVHTPGNTFFHIREGECTLEGIVDTAESTPSAHEDVLDRRDGTFSDKRVRTTYETCTDDHILRWADTCENLRHFLTQLRRLEDEVDILTEAPSGSAHADASSQTKDSIPIFRIST